MIATVYNYDDSVFGTIQFYMGLITDPFSGVPYEGWRWNFISASSNVDGQVQTNGAVAELWAGGKMRGKAMPLILPGSLGQDFQLFLPDSGPYVCTVTSVDAARRAPIQTATMLEHMFTLRG